MAAGEPGVLQTILRDHWAQAEGMLAARLPESVASAVRDGVLKALRCRTEANGFARYRCADCGASHTVCFTCKSRLCPTCGRVRSAEAASNACSRLLNVNHRHLTFSVPSELRGLLYVHRELLGVVAKAAAQATLHAVGTRCRAHAPIPGVMATVHTFGRDLSWHVHVHVLCTEGGLRADNVWQPVHLFPATQYRKLWQHFLLMGLRRALKDNRFLQRQIGGLYRKYPSGFIVNVMSRYRNGQQAAAYCCPYTGRPPLSERRIVAYDGEQVTLAYQDYRDGQDKTLTLPAADFLLRVMQHVWPRYQRGVHYYGLYQPSRRKRHAAAVAQASRYHEQVLPKPALSRRERLQKAMAELNLRCPACGGPLVFGYIKFPRRHHAPKSRPKTQANRTQLCLRM
jgi:hypothetical protein